MDKTSKEIWADYRNGRKFYLASEELEKTAQKGECPNCHKIVHITKYNHIMRDFESDEPLKDETDYIDYWCDMGCDLSSMDFYKPTLDKQTLKRTIMNSRARLIGDSLEVYNESDNPYLHGFNCLYIHWQLLPSGEYSVFFDYYLEHGYQGRDSEVGKKEMLVSKKKPSSEEAKELLYAWMIERFEAITSND